MNLCMCVCVYVCVGEESESQVPINQFRGKIPTIVFFLCYVCLDSIQVSTLDLNLDFLLKEVRILLDSSHEVFRFDDSVVSYFFRIFFGISWSGLNYINEPIVHRL